MADQFESETPTFEKLARRWQGQDVAYTSAPLTAALCYGRVLVPRDALTNERAAGGEAIRDHWSYVLVVGDRKDRGSILGFGFEEDGKPIFELAAMDFEAEMPWRERAAEFSSVVGGNLIPVLSTPFNLDRIFSRGNREVIVASIKGLRIVDEDQLTIGQVIEFRCDKQAAKKYQRMLRWLDTTMVGKTEAEVVDTIEQKLEDYEWAIKKHGIKTVTGAVSELLQGKYLLGTSGVAATLAATGHPDLGILAGAGLAVGKICVSVATSMLDHADVVRGSNSEIAWLFDLKKGL